MGTIKIGEAELSLISKIGQLVEKNKVRLEGAIRGLRLIENQILSIKGNKEQYFFYHQPINHLDYKNYYFLFSYFLVMIYYVPSLLVNF